MSKLAEHVSVAATPRKIFVRFHDSRKRVVKLIQLNPAEATLLAEELVSRIEVARGEPSEMEGHA